MIAINRKGQTFQIGDIVRMVDAPVLYPSVIGKDLEIIDIIHKEACESGFNILAKDIENNKHFEHYLDTNWFVKI